MPTKRRVLVRKVRAFGGWEDEKRGKGGHRLLMRPDPEAPTRRLGTRCSSTAATRTSPTASSGRCAVA